MGLKNNIQTGFRKAISGVILICFFSGQILPPSAASAQTASILNLPMPGAMVGVSPSYVPIAIKGIKVFSDNPFRFDFILDTGNSKLSTERLNEETKLLIKYFLTALTIPDNDQWVNLSPYEHDRIVPNEFGITEMGRDLLAQDYLLKQLTASLIYPEHELGKKFWERVYKKAYEKYGDVDIPVSTFNKVWVMPEHATVYQHGNTAVITESRLRVLLEEDYVALVKNGEASSVKSEALHVSQTTNDDKDVNSLGSQIIREIVLPEIEKEINEGKNFAKLRQIYHSMILAAWFKRKLKGGILSKMYVGANKVAGVDVSDKEIKQKIYEQYLAAYKKGVYNYVREEFDEHTQETIPRKYFSGGVIAGAEVERTTEVVPATREQLSQAAGNVTGNSLTVSVGLEVAADDAGAVADSISAGDAQGTSDKAQLAEKIARNTVGALVSIAAVLSPKIEDITEKIQDRLSRFGFAASPALPKEYQEKLEPLIKIPWKALPPETREFIRQYPMADLVQMAEASTWVQTLFRDVLPRVAKTFTRSERREYWSEIMDLVNKAGFDPIARIHHFRGIIHSREDFKSVARTLTQLNAALDAKGAFGLGAEAVSKIVRTPTEFEDISPDLIRMYQRAEYVLSNDLPVFVSRFTPEEVRKYWKVFAAIIIEKGGIPHKAHVIAALSIIKEMISTPEDFRTGYEILTETFNFDFFATNFLFGLKSFEQIQILNRDLVRWNDKNEHLRLLGLSAEMVNIMRLMGSDFEYSRVASLTREILVSEIPNYVNIFSRMRFSKNLTNSQDQEFRDFVVNPDVKLSLRMGMMDTYSEIFANEKLFPVTKNPFGAAAKFRRIIERTRKDLNAVMKDLAVAGLSKSQQRKIAEKIKIVMVPFRKAYLEYILGRDISDKEIQLIDNPEIKQKIITILSIVATLGTVNFKESELMRSHIRGALDELFSAYNSSVDEQAFALAIAKLNEFIMNLPAPSTADQTQALKSNKAVRDELVTAGYSPELWSKGIEFETIALNGITEQGKRENIQAASFEMVEIAMGLGIRQVNGTDVSLDRAAELNSYDKAKQFIDGLKVSEIAIPADKQARLEDILYFIQGQEAQKVIDTPEEAKFRVTIKKDFLNEATAGLGVPGCFAPSGIHREMPLIHAFESNAGFIQVYAENGRQVANAVVIYTNDGAYVDSIHNSSFYDMEEIFGKALVQLTQYVPQLVLHGSSAGYQYLSRYAKPSQENMILVKPATVYTQQYFDSGKVDLDGQLSFVVITPLIITKADIIAKDGTVEKVLQEPDQEIKQVTPVRADINLQELADIFIAKGEKYKPYLFLVGALKKRIAQEGETIVNDGFYDWVKALLNNNPRTKDVTIEESDEIADVMIDFLEAQDWPIRIDSPPRETVKEIERLKAEVNRNQEEKNASSPLVEEPQAAGDAVNNIVNDGSDRAMLAIVQNMTALSNGAGTWEKLKAQWEIVDLIYSPGGIQKAGLKRDGADVEKDEGGNYPHWVYVLENTGNNKTAYVGPDDVRTLFGGRINEIVEWRNNKEKQISEYVERLKDIHILQRLLGETQRASGLLQDIAEGKPGDRHFETIDQVVEEYNQRWQSGFSNDVSLERFLHIYQDLKQTISSSKRWNKLRFFSETDQIQAASVMDKLNQGQSLTPDDAQLMMRVHKRILDIINSLQQESLAWGQKKAVVVQDFVNPRRPAYHANIWVASWLKQTFGARKNKPLILDVGANVSVLQSILQTIAPELSGTVVDLEKDPTIYANAPNSFKVRADISNLDAGIESADPTVRDLVAEMHNFDAVVANFVLDQLEPQEVRDALKSVGRLLNEAKDQPVLVITLPKNSPLQGSGLDSVLRELGYEVISQAANMSNALTAQARDRIFAQEGKDYLDAIEATFTNKIFHAGVYRKTRDVSDDEIERIDLSRLQIRQGAGRRNDTGEGTGLSGRFDARAVDLSDIFAGLKETDFEINSGGQIVTKNELEQNEEFKSLRSDLDVLVWVNKMLSLNPALLNSIAKLRALKKNLEAATTVDEMLKDDKRAYLPADLVQSVVTAPGKINLTLKETALIAVDVGEHFKKQQEADKAKWERENKFAVDYDQLKTQFNKDLRAKVYSIGEVYKVYAALLAQVSVPVAAFNEQAPQKKQSADAQISEEKLFWHRLPGINKELGMDEMFDVIGQSVAKFTGDNGIAKLEDVANDLGIDVFWLNYLIYKFRYFVASVTSKVGPIERLQIPTANGERRELIRKAAASLEAKYQKPNVKAVEDALGIENPTLSRWKRGGLLTGSETWESLGVKPGLGSRTGFDVEAIEPGHLISIIRGTVENLKQQGIRPIKTRVIENVGLGSASSWIPAFTKLSDLGYSEKALGIQISPNVELSERIFSALSKAIVDLNAEGKALTRKAIDQWLEVHDPELLETGWLPNSDYNDSNRRKMRSMGIILSDSIIGETSQENNSDRSMLSQTPAPTVKLEFPLFDEQTSYESYSGDFEDYKLYNEQGRGELLNKIDNRYLRNIIRSLNDIEVSIAPERKEYLLQIVEDFFWNGVDAILHKLDEMDYSELDQAIKQAKITYSYRENPSTNEFEIFVSDTGTGINGGMFTNWKEGIFDSTKPDLYDEEGQPAKGPYSGRAGFGIPNILRWSMGNGFTITIVSKSQEDAVTRKLVQTPDGNRTVVDVPEGRLEVGTDVIITATMDGSKMASTLSTKENIDVGGIDMKENPVNRHDLFVNGKLNSNGLVLVHAASGLPQNGRLLPNSQFGGSPYLLRNPRHVIEFSLNGLINLWGNQKVVVLIPFQKAPKEGMVNLWFNATSYLGEFEIPEGATLLVDESIDLGDQKDILSRKGIEIVRFSQQEGAVAATQRNLKRLGYQPMELNFFRDSPTGASTWRALDTGIDYTKPFVNGEIENALESLREVGKEWNVPFAGEALNYDLGYLTMSMESIHKWLKNGFKGDPPLLDLFNFNYKLGRFRGQSFDKSINFGTSRFFVFADFYSTLYAGILQTEIYQWYRHWTTPEKVGESNDRNSLFDSLARSKGRNFTEEKEAFIQRVNTNYQLNLFSSDLNSRADFEGILQKIALKAEEIKRTELYPVSVSDNKGNLQPEGVSKIDPPGGIDMNANALNLQTEGTQIQFDMPFDPEQWENIKFDGFTPVILQINTTNLPLFIGANDTNNSIQLSSV